MLYVVLLFLSAYLTLNLHELSHVVVCKLLGGKITAYMPWPHVRKDTGTWVFGETICAFRESVPPCARFSYIAPLVKASAFFVLWLTLTLTIWSTFAIFMFWEALDAFWWIHGYCYRRRGSDGCEWRSS